MLKTITQVLGESDMANAQTDEPTRQKPLRLWPGVVAVVLQWLAWFGLPFVASEIIAGLVGAFARLVGGLAIIVWWAFFSRAPRFERWGAVVLMIVAMVATPRLLHESVATGNAGLQFFFHAIPVLSLVFVVWAVAGRHLADGPRRAAMVATILLACGVFALLRSDGITGDGAAEFAWRWAETAEERLLAQAGDEPMALPLAPRAAARPICFSRAVWAAWASMAGVSVVMPKRPSSRLVATSSLVWP